MNGHTISKRVWYSENLPTKVSNNFPVEVSIETEQSSDVERFSDQDIMESDKEDCDNQLKGN